MKILALVVILACSSVASAESGPAIAPTAGLGMFFEFGDQAGTSGGFALWLGGSVYADVEPNAAQTAGYLSLGVELRTGLLPLLTGPNEITPQLRGGIAFLGGSDFLDSDDPFYNVTFPKSKLYAAVGYRWASAFGWDNMNRRRKNESAFRLGVGAATQVFNAWIDEPFPNTAEFIVDIEEDGAIDRLGASVLIGF